MGYGFTVTKRVFEKNAIIAFIDLLGTRELYNSSLPSEEQAIKIMSALLTEFDSVFSEHFDEKERADYFDISIFADSIVISQRKKIKNIIRRLMDFSLHYQERLLLNSYLQDEVEYPSRIIIVKDSFFSFKLRKASPQSILNSYYTTVSLCGGKGIKFAHDSLKGLPIGVYATDKIKQELNLCQKRIIPVNNEEIFFVKQEENTTAFYLLPQKIRDALSKNQNPEIKTIKDELRKKYRNEKSVKKLLPWILVHMGKQNKIIRNNNPLMSNCSKSEIRIY